MKTKITIYPSGASAMLEKAGGWYHAIARSATGAVLDRIRLEDYRMAMDYYRAFKALARRS